MCTFNPTYDQGMTVAAVQAATLDALLTARISAAANKPAAVAFAGKQLSGAANSAGSDVCNTSDQNTKSTTNSTCPSNSSSSSSSNSSTTGWLSGLHSEFQAAIHTSVKNAWDMAAGGDMKYSTATSNEPYKPSVVERLAGAYVMELFKLAGTDYQVTHLQGLKAHTGSLDVAS